MENDIFWLSITEKQGNDCLDFSVNVNPLGIPDTVIKSISKLPSIMQYYPDPGCTEIIKLLSSKYGVSASNILCGNGADDLLYRLVFSMKPKQALIIEPTFEEYNRALQLVGCEVQHYQLNPLSQFELDENVLTAIVPDMDMVFSRMSFTRLLINVRRTISHWLSMNVLWNSSPTGSSSA